MEALTSSTRQIAPIKRMGRDSDSGVLATDYYPAPRRHRIGMEVEIGDWLWSEYASVVYPVERLGTEALLGVVVNYSDVVDATLNAEDEADRELFFVGSLTELPERSLGGADDDRASASLRLLQVV